MGLTSSQLLSRLFFTDALSQGRAGAPPDIAGPVLFLTSRAGAYVNGNTLDVGGGRSLVSPALLFGSTQARRQARTRRQARRGIGLVSSQRRSPLPVSALKLTLPQIRSFSAVPSSLEDSFRRLSTDTGKQKCNQCSLKAGLQLAGLSSASNQLIHSSAESRRKLTRQVITSTSHCIDLQRDAQR